jgi:hypothetical protein
MEAVGNSRGAELASRLNIGEVTSWRLHWLVCKLQSLQKVMHSADFGSSADLTSGKFADFMTELKTITLEFGRLKWEVKTMLGFDYEDEVAPLFQHVDHYGTYLEEVGNVKEYLDRKAGQILEAAATRVQESIRNMGQGF